MNNLSEGMLEFDGIIVNKNTTIKDIEDKFSEDKIKIRRRPDNSAVARFLIPIMLGSKKFNVRISFENEKISGIDLRVNDPCIDEYDYEEKLGQHGDWLVEEIGYPAGILNENRYEWGKITQWDDFRSRDAGISIVYF